MRGTRSVRFRYASTCWGFWNNRLDDSYDLIAVNAPMRGFMVIDLPYYLRSAIPGGWWNGLCSTGNKGLLLMAVVNVEKNAPIYR